MANKYDRRCWERENDYIIPKERKKAVLVKKVHFCVFFHSFNLAELIHFNCVSENHQPAFILPKS